MSWDALLLVSGMLGALLPAAVPAQIAVCFAPEQDCADFAVRAIDAARQQVLVGAYNLTTARASSRHCCRRSAAAWMCG